jgi:hypothetical protein
MSAWKRWLNYAKAKLDSTVRSANDDLDRKEAELEARNEGKPWLAEDNESPTYDTVKARIEHDSPDAGPAPRSDTASNDLAADLAEQQRAADQRLEEIRKSLGLDEEK